MANLSNNIALVALIVSLVALLIALGQALQQFLGTAEGYRRCAKQVIGPWHRLRWRHWIWTEFRYETHFVTPRFMLSSPRDFGDSEGQPTGLTTLKPGPRPSVRAWKWLRKSSREDAVLEAPAVLSRSVFMPVRDKVHGNHLRNRQRKPNARSSTHESVVDEEKVIEGSSSSALSTPVSNTRRLLQSENTASWLILLRQMHGIYVAGKTKRRASTQLNHYPRPKAPKNYQRPNDSRLDNGVETEVTVAFTEWVWDIMPNEISKPLATTTLGALIAFALRMGMQWRSLEMVRSQLLADGNGFSISFTEIPGLGMVAKLNNIGTHYAMPALIPGRAVDKMMCGIIPGARYLVDQDIPCVSDDRIVTIMPVIASRITSEKRLLELWDKHKFWETHNEAVSLLCEFLPVSSSSSTTHYFWGWAPTRQSVFSFYEARFAFWRHLKRREDEGSLDDEGLASVLQHLSYMQRTYSNDAFGLNAFLAVAAADGKDQEERLQTQSKFIEDGRSIFNWTTEWFLEHDFWTRDRSSDTSSFRTWYMHLVAAHCIMSYNAIVVACQRTDKNKAIPGWGDKYKEGHFSLKDRDYGIPIKYDFFNGHLYVIGEAYIEFLDHNDFGVLKYMRDQELGLSDHTVRTAWWVLMLRGIVWSMATMDARRGEPIPSSYYDNDTPVWIT